MIAIELKIVIIQCRRIKLSGEGEVIAFILIPTNPTASSRAALRIT